MFYWDPRKRGFIKVGPVGIGFGPLAFWCLPDWIDVERTADEIVITLRLPKDLKKEEIKVEFREGVLRIRYPRKGRGWEEIPIE